MRIRLFVPLLLLVLAASCGDSDNPVAPPAAPTNHAPVVLAQGDTSVAVGASIVLHISASDPDGDSLTYGAIMHVSLADIFQGTLPFYTIDRTTGVYEFTPQAYDQPYRWTTFYAVDPGGAGDSTMFKIVVN